MKQLTILAPTRYPWLFNGPRHSRHRIARRGFVPLNKLDKRLEGVTVLDPWPPRRFDLVHAFNRIPVGGTPYVIGFESHLPRGYGVEDTAYFRRLRQSLASARCRRIVAISDRARQIFLAQHQGTPELGALEAKLLTRFPNLPVTEPAEDGAPPLGPIRLVFAGAHFGRKGGCVAVRIAELAHQRGHDIVVEIVSALEVGGGIWTDPADPAFFEPYLRLLALPNVVHHGALSNAALLARLRTAHFCLLPTFGDTFGYSAIEAMAQFTPVVATRVGALPEFITDGESGILLDLATKPVTGGWIHSAAPHRATEAFRALFRAEVERLAEEALSRILELASAPQAYAAMRRAAKRAAIHHFDAGNASAYWDALYEAVA